MSLFPAYSQDDPEKRMEFQLEQVPELSPACEAKLLASDDENDKALPTPLPPPPSPFHIDFYIDPKYDCGNLGVSTLYYPGRPQYVSRNEGEALGCTELKAPRTGRKRRRYFEAIAEPEPFDEERAARVATFRSMLADAPRDVDLWLKFIRFQEQCSGLGAAVEAANDACSRASHAALRRERHRLACRHLPEHQYLASLRDDIAAEKNVGRRCELWLFLLRALAASPAGCSAQALGSAAAAAMRDTAALAHAYPHLLYAYGSYLRAAGMMETMVLLVELVASMCFPPASFPPPLDAALEAGMERHLLGIEEEVSACGLPLGIRWVRVERARADVHWRPLVDPTPDQLQEDPQRAPLAADVADLLLPLVGADASFLLCAQLLRLAKVPLLPCGEYVRRAFAWGGVDASDDCAETLLAVCRAARRLPPAHPARPSPSPSPSPAPASASATAQLLAALLDPPHYTHHENGFLPWVSALWHACCTWVEGDERRVALLCWRLRWMHAIAMQDPQNKKELRRMRHEARTALRLHAGASALPFAQFARLEALAAGPGAGAAAARKAARAALADPDAPSEHRLYVARVAAEMPAEYGPGLWGVACAVLGRALPPDAGLRAPPPRSLVHRALELAEQRCDELEKEYAETQEGVAEDEPGSGARAVRALLPGAGEWASARVLLAPPPRRRQLLQRLVDAPHTLMRSDAAARYWEQAASALAATAAAHHQLAAYARRLAAAFPGNALLALACSGSVTWAAGAGADADALRRTEHGALAELLPHVLRAVHGWFAGNNRDKECVVASRVALRACRRASRGAGAGPTLWATLIEASGRSDNATVTPMNAMLAATDACPAHKWLYVRGAAWSGDSAAADAALDRQLRLHALPDELLELEPAAPAEPRPSGPDPDEE